jgi:hypothetical protein
MAIQQNTGFRMMEGGLEDTPLTMSEDASRTAFDQVTSGISNLYQNMLQRSPDLVVGTGQPSEVLMVVFKSQHLMRIRVVLVADNIEQTS